MENWIKISILLCIFGFFREFRPSEPFVTEFLSGEWRNITADQLNRDVYPFGTYSYLGLLVVVFLITDILRYKPIIIVSACVAIIIYSLLLWTYSLEFLQVVQILYGCFMAAEVAYYTYIFAKVNRSYYQRVTGHTRSAILVGRFVSSVIAQLFISFQVLDFRQLNYLTLSGQCVSLILALFLPSVERSLYFYSDTKQETSVLPSIYRNTDENIAKFDINYEHSANDIDRKKNPKFSCTGAMLLIWNHFKTSYSNKIVIQWSFWWALAMCGFLQVQNYVQILWKEIDDGRESMYNGAVEAALTLLGALGAFSAGFLNSTYFDRWDIWIIGICSLIEGIFIIISAITDSVYLAYAMYILFGTVYHFMITIASATVAKNIIDDSFALIFGVNTFIALAFQAILTVVIVSDIGLELDIRNQFLVCGGYFVVLAGMYSIVGLIKMIVSKFKRRTFRTN